jgi:hypothetical protein
VLIGVNLGTGDGPSSQPEFAAAALRVAESNPRLLVTAEGWQVVSANDFELDSGEIRFGNGEHELDVTWYPADRYKTYYRDRSFVDDSPDFIDLLGTRARTVSYSDHDFATMLPPQGRVFVEIRTGLAGGGMDADEYQVVLDSLRAVDIDAWLSAMPPNVVRPTDQASVLGEMLADIPLPPGFDTSRLESDSAVLDRYQLGAKVTGTVACEWLDRWVSASRTDDQSAAVKASDALATTQNWTILDEMAKQGAWPQVLRGYANIVVRAQGDGLDSLPAYASTLGEFQKNYQQGLGCGRRAGGGG